MATRWRSGSTFEMWRSGPSFELGLLCRNGEYISNAEIATNRSARRTGLQRREFLECALWIPRCRWIHSFGVKFAIDVAYLDHHGVVIRVERVKPQSLCNPVLAARSVVESYAGAMQKWGLQEGDHLYLIRGFNTLQGAQR